MSDLKPTRAAGMAATYADILTKAGVIESQQMNKAPVPVLHDQIVKGKVDWWAVCLAQLPGLKK